MHNLFCVSESGGREQLCDVSSFLLSGEIGWLNLLFGWKVAKAKTREKTTNKIGKKNCYLYKREKRNKKTQRLFKAPCLFLFFVSCFCFFLFCSLLCMISFPYCQRGHLPNYRRDESWTCRWESERTRSRGFLVPSSRPKNMCKTPIKNKIETVYRKG